METGCMLGGKESALRLHSFPDCTLPEASWRLVTIILITKE